MKSEKTGHLNLREILCLCVFVAKKQQKLFFAEISFRFYDMR